jgi:predicted nuclease with TOPRIM domain
MDRFIADENGNMMKCSKGAWVKHDDYEHLKKHLTRLTIESIEREKKVAKIEGEVEWLRDKFIEFNLREHELKKRLENLEGDEK